MRAPDLSRLRPTRLVARSSSGRPARARVLELEALERRVVLSGGGFPGITAGPTLPWTVAESPTDRHETAVPATFASHGSRGTVRPWIEANPGPGANSPILVSGQAAPWSLVRIEVSGQRLFARADRHGDFQFVVNDGPGTTALRVLARMRGGRFHAVTLTVTRPSIEAQWSAGANASGPSVTGTVADAEPVSQLWAGFDGTPVVSFVNVSSDLGAGGQFTLGPGELVRINGGPLADGTHVLSLRAIDAAGASSLVSTTFVLAAPAPAAPTFNLAPAGNGTVTGNGQTTLSTVTLVGQTTPDVTVGVVGTLMATTSDSSGSFTLVGIALNPGPNTLTVRATNGLGESSEVTQTITRVQPPDLFQDPNLEAAVRAALGLPSSQVVTQGELQGLTTLSADSNQISSLAGLQYATNLQTLNLLPSDWSAPGHLTDLSPLEGLQHLSTVALVDTGIGNSALSALEGMPKLQSLDLRDDPITNIAPIAQMRSLANLQIYGDAITDLSPLAGRLVNVDVVPADPGAAQTIPALATALDKLPIAIFQYVVDNFTYQPYAGARKGAQATLETGGGNDWDLDALLAGLLSQAGVSTQYVSGTVDVGVQSVMSWLNVTDPTAAGQVLADAGLDPVPVLSASGQTVGFKFQHTWIQALLPVPGTGTQWVNLDPTWKFQTVAPGVSNVLSLVPFNPQSFLAQQQTDLPSQFYESQVAAYLAANQPSVSLADVAQTGPIQPQVFSALPTTLPYTVVGATTTSSQIPQQTNYRVGLTLKQGNETLFTEIYALPQISLERVTIGYASLGNGQVRPELLLGGNIVAQGASVASGSNVTLVVDHYDPGSATVSQSFSFARQAGQYLSVGLDAGQYGNAYLAQQQQDVNTAAIAAADNQPFTTEDQVGAFLALAVATYFHNTDAADVTLDGLTGAVPIFNHVATAVTTSDTTVTYDWSLPNPAVPNGIDIDVPDGYHQQVALNGNTANDTARGHLLDFEGSAEESAVWEQVADSAGISTVKSLQLAVQQGIPILTITKGNAATLIPELTIDPATIAAIQSQVNAGATVTVPRNPTPLGQWQGVGYIVTIGTGSAQKEGFVITGGLATQYDTTLSGGSGTNSTPRFNLEVSYNEDTNQTTAGDPVNIANGDVNQVETDITLPGISLPLDFTRRYDSQNTADVGLGVGWVYSDSDHLTINTNGSILWTDSQGHEYTFTPNGHGGYVTPTTIFGTFTATGSGYTFVDTTGLELQFNASGRLIETNDRNGNALDITYNANGQIAHVIEADAPERALTFTYTGIHITSISDGTGRTWTYSYTGNELAAVASPTDAQTPAAVEQYAYYTDTARVGLLRQVTLPNGGVTTFSYYGDGRAYQVTDPDGFTDTYTYDLYDNLTAYTDARGNTTTYGYNSQGEQTSIRFPDNATESFVWQNDLMTASTDVFGQTETYTYDARGNLTKDVDRAGNVTTYAYDPVYSQVTSINQPGGRVTTFTYDSHGNPIKITDALGNVTTMTYDSHGLVLTVTTPRGNQPGATGDFTTTYAYNDAGQVLTVTTGLPSTVSYSYDNRGHLRSTTDEDGNTTTYEYDLIDRLIQTTNALGDVTTYTYDAIGDLVATTDALGRTTRSVYDPDRRLVEVINADGSILTAGYDPVGNLVTSTDELGRTTHTYYDDRNRAYATVTPDLAVSLARYDGEGRLVASTDPLGNVTTNAYDKLDRLVSTTDALGETTKYTYDALGNLLSVTDPLNRITTYTYDLLNRQVSVTDPLGHTTTTTYDADGNIASVTDPLHQTTKYTYDVLDRLTSSTDPLNEVTSETYDAAGNVLSITDPTGNTTTYAYDALNREASETNALGGTRTYGYDKVGNLTTYIDADGRKTVYTYDDRYRETSEQWLDATGAPIHTFRYSYDPAGELTSASDSDSSYSYTYDPLGRVTSINNQGTPGVPPVVLTYSYDAAGNEVSVGDTINGAASGTQSMTYDAVDRMTQITLSGAGILPERVNLSYDAASELTKLTRYADLAGNSLVASTSYTYDNAGQLTQQTDARGTTTLAHYQWTLDADGRVTQETSTDGTTTYAYNAANELTSATSTSQPSESYAYDANGNRTGTGIQTGKNNELLSDGTYNYSYDAEGNLVKKTDIATGAVTRYTWDYHNRLTKVVYLNASGTETGEVDYTYDVNDELIGESVQTGAPGSQAPVVQRFVYDGTNIALVFNGAGALTDRYLYGPGVDQVLADENSAGQISWFLTDDLGTVRTVINSSGTVLDHLQYDSFGRIVSQTSPSAAPLFGFAGQMFDRATGLQYDQARFYDPSTGRFLSQDPLSFDGGNANLYSYVGNAPTDATDPTGLMGWDRNSNDTADASAADNSGTDESATPGGYFQGEVSETGPDNSVGAPGFWEGLIPVWGSARSAVNDFQNGRWGWGIVNSALAVSDVFLVKSAVTAGVKLVGKLGAELLAKEAATGGAEIGAKNLANDARAVGNSFMEGQEAERAGLGGCFPADTLVSTSDGLRPIQEIRSGDQVWGYDLAAREWTLRPVLETVEQNFLGEVVDVTVAGEVISATHNHPFWVVEGDRLAERARPEHVLPTPGEQSVPGRWVDAGNLKVGDVLLLKTSGRAVVGGLTTRQSAQTVYNISVQHLHTYAVGSVQVLVHNNNPCAQKPRISNVPNSDFVPNANVSQRYSRPSGAGPTAAQRASVQGKPCVECGKVTPNQVADHIDPLVVQHFREGAVDVAQQAQVSAVQPHCPGCSSVQGGLLSAFSKKMKAILGL
ncbi:MAG: RHS repeat-associated core domain-containing protein [Isosphaeraceae bacterium]|nr:RHS repeat-associated core domain-containing protein [Isosphaeraceae bacterium]